jgi:hypothetical protein
MKSALMELEIDDIRVQLVGNLRREARGYLESGA